MTALKIGQWQVSFEQAFKDLLGAIPRLIIQKG